MLTDSQYKNLMQIIRHHLMKLTTYATKKLGYVNLNLKFNQKKTDSKCCRFLRNSINIIDKRECNPHSNVVGIHCRHQDCLARFHQQQRSTTGRMVDQTPSYHEFVQWLCLQSRSEYHQQTRQFHLHSTLPHTRDKQHQRRVVSNEYP